MNKGTRILVVGTTVVIAIAVWILCAPFLARFLIIEKPLKTADVILVLSGSSTYKERAKAAAEVYRRGVSSKILLTNDGGFAGWSKEERRNPPFVELSKKELIKHGVRDEDIRILDRQVTGTIYEARIVTETQVVSNWKSLLLVTSPYHTRRALWVFRRELPKTVEIGVVSTEPEDRTTPVYTWWLSRRGWIDVAGEYVKFAVYWMFY